MSALHNFSLNDVNSLVMQFFGTGRELNYTMPGKPGYKEAIGFQEYIGVWKFVRSSYKESESRKCHPKRKKHLN